MSRSPEFTVRPQDPPPARRGRYDIVEADLRSAPGVWHLIYEDVDAGYAKSVHGTLRRRGIQVTCRYEADHADVYGMWPGGVACAG